MTDIRNITILTGAGISAESGIPVFRSETGLWEQHRVNDVATYEGFLKNKTLVHSFYNKMRSKLANVLPNDAHYALTKLQSNWNNGKVTIITQNIDDLHERASSQDVIHMHGELKSLLCEACGKSVRWNQDSSVDTQCPYCKSKKMRPNIVWFGEVPYNMDSIYRILDQTSLFLSIGTSGVVYPAAGFAEYTPNSLHGTATLTGTIGGSGSALDTLDKEAQAIEASRRNSVSKKPIPVSYDFTKSKN